MLDLCTGKHSKPNSIVLKKLGAAIDDFLRNWIKSPVWGFDIPKAEGPRHIASKFRLNLIILDNPYLFCR
ncbi:hypothetical protein T4D_12078, partial [Trichinella pseudospiralis]